MDAMSKIRTITFLPTPDVDKMIKRALGNLNGELPYGTRTRLINDSLRERLKKMGFARKRDLQVA